MMPIIPLRAFEAAPRIIVYPAPITVEQSGKLSHWNNRVHRWHRGRL